MTETLTLDELDERLKAFPVAMLATIGPDGHIHARPMMTQPREPGGELWFASALDTDKIAEIRQNPHVGVIYFRDRDNAYVSVAGDAEVRDDAALVHRLWQESWRPWFPEGPDQRNLCIITIDAHSAELWEPQHGNLGVRLAIAKAALTGDTPHVNPPQDVRLDDEHRRSA